MAKKQKTKWEERERRLRLVMGWMKAGVTDSETLAARVMSELKYDHRARAERLIADARSVLSGEKTLADLRGGRPREVVRKIDINDMQRIVTLADALARDSQTRKGAYLHAGSELGALIGAIQALAREHDIQPEPA